MNQHPLHLCGIHGLMVDSDHKPATALSLERRRPLGYLSKISYLAEDRNFVHNTRLVLHDETHRIPLDGLGH